MQSAAYDNTKPAGAADSIRQYTFSWQFTPGDKLTPRGGTSKGPMPTLRAERTEWTTLQSAAIGIEKDRAAILAMAGSFRASFDFVKVLGYAPDYRPSAPYQSWGTERVIVLEQSADKIVLQHVLEMRIKDAEGKVSAPFVTKHWRQDWTSENYSTWLGDEGARPLPRREWSVRSDYAYLQGSNRHTITPTGWVHEQQNNKVKSFEHPVTLAREFGFNRYEAIEEDLEHARAYVDRTEPLWAAVRQRWQFLLSHERVLKLKAAPDQGQLFLPLFKAAEQLKTVQVDQAAIQAMVDAYLVPPSTGTHADNFFGKTIPSVSLSPSCKTTSERIAKRDCDRDAIRAMAGEFAVSFAFQETVPLSSDYALRPATRTEAFEKVMVIQDDPDYISLQHILASADGRVTKHWRQDWHFESTRHWHYLGDGRFALKDNAAAKAPANGHNWFTDAPRYAGTGSWNHRYGNPTWTSNRTWRPLPRREYTTRADYQLINAENRHTIAPTGWTHEQDNSKVMRIHDIEQPLVREFGFNSYRRIGHVDFSSVDRYWLRTAPYWHRVRARWAFMLEQPQFRLSDRSEALAKAMFEVAQSRQSASDRVDESAIVALLKSHLASPRATAQSDQH
jgi:hypothetical protein